MRRLRAPFYAPSEPAPSDVFALPAFGGEPDVLSARLSPVKSFGAVCRDIRIANGLSQIDVAVAGGLEQSRVSEIERGRYLPGLDLAARLAQGLGVTLTEVVAQWEGSVDVGPAKGRQRVRRRLPPAFLDVPQ